ncbi:MAG: hypothetical protein ACTSRZ_16610 [Promethearchaeota archaeon]
MKKNLKKQKVIDRTRSPQKNEVKTRKRDYKFYLKLVLIIFTISFWSFLYIDMGVAFNNNKSTLWIHAPSIIKTNEFFDFSVEAWDIYERLAGSYRGEISYSLESYNLSDFSMLNDVDFFVNNSTYKFNSNFKWKGIAPAYHFKGADNGKAQFKAMTNKEGIHYIVVNEKEDSIINTYRSNPILVLNTTEDIMRLYWGDIHGHTLYSDGSGTPDETYKFARDVALLDFAALTDHAELMLVIKNKDIFRIFNRYKTITNLYNQDNKFMTLLTMEYTPMLIEARSYLAIGHINLYFKGNDFPFFSSMFLYNPNELYKYINENYKDEFIGWPHHTTRKGQCADFGYYNESINRMIEIYSCHGSSEFNDERNIYHEVDELPVNIHGVSISDALKMGYRFGLMASSDCHDGKLGHSIFHTRARVLNQCPFSLSAYRYGIKYTGGLTGVFCYNLTREGIFNSLKNRVAFASMWTTRWLANFSINGQMFGINNSEVIVPLKNSSRNLELFLAADGISLKQNRTNLIEKVDIFKNSELWQSFEPKSILYRAKIIDNLNIMGTSYPYCIKKPDGKYYINSISNNPVEPSKLSTNGVDYYYVRATDSNDKSCWIGPIWVRSC